MNSKFRIDLENQTLDLVNMFHCLINIGLYFENQDLTNTKVLLKLESNKFGDFVL